MHRILDFVMPRVAVVSVTDTRFWELLEEQQTGGWRLTYVFSDNDSDPTRDYDRWVFVQKPAKLVFEWHWKNGSRIFGTADVVDRIARSNRLVTRRRWVMPRYWNPND